MVCGRSPAVLFYLLDRHALLAMTMGSKWIISNSLTTLGCAHPSNRGELAARRDEGQVPLCGGVARYRAPRKCNFRGWLCQGGYCVPRRSDDRYGAGRTKEQIIPNYDFDFFCRIFCCSSKIFVSRFFIVSINRLFSSRNFSKSWRLTKISFDRRRVFWR